MLSRNQIRIKIFHCIYSSYINKDIKDQEFKKSFDSYKNLYEKILEILIHISDGLEKCNNFLYKKTEQPDWKNKEKWKKVFKKD